MINDERLDLTSGVELYEAIWLVAMAATIATLAVVTILRRIAR